MKKRIKSSSRQEGVGVNNPVAPSPRVRVADKRYRCVCFRRKKNVCSRPLTARNGGRRCGDRHTIITYCPCRCQIDRDAGGRADGIVSVAKKVTENNIVIRTREIQITRTDALFRDGRPAATHVASSIKPMRRGANGPVGV